MLICPVCQTKNPDGSQLCMACGSVFEPQGRRVSGATAAASTAGERSSAAGEPIVLERDSKGFQWLMAPEEEGDVLEFDFSKQKDPTEPRRSTAEVSSEPKPPAPVLGGPLSPVALGWAESIPVIEAPELAPLPDLPFLIRSLPAPDGGVFSKVSYAISSRGVVRRQKDALKTLTTTLAKLRRNEKECIEALGRAARRHNLTPSHLLDRAAAADLEEMAAQDRRDQAGAKQWQGMQAEQLFMATHRAGQARLEKLREVSAPLLERMQELEKRMATAQTELDELIAKEKELGDRAQTKPTEEELGGEIHMENDRIIVSRRSIDDEIAARMGAHHECLAQLSEVKETHARLSETIKATRAPLERIKAEAKKIRTSVAAAQERAKAAKTQALAAAVSGQRRTDFAHRTAGELDTQIGQALLDEDEPNPALDRLINSIETCKRRAKTVESALSEQSDQLSLFDAESAKSGMNLLFVLILVALILVGAGVYTLNTLLGS